MKKDKLIRALDVCVQSIKTNQDLEQVLFLYPKERSELAPLIRSAYIAHQLGRSWNISQDVLSKNRTEFIQLSQTVVPVTQNQTRNRRGSASLLIVIVLVLFILLGISYMSQRALPGSVFYSLKEASRDFRLSVIEDSQSYINASLQMDDQRLEEIQTLISLEREAWVSFGGRITQGDAGEWLVSGINLASNTETQLVGDIWPGYYVRVYGNLQTDGTVLAKRIQIQQFLIRGNVEAVTPERITINAIEVLLTPDTLVQGDILPGSMIEVHALLADHGLYRARLIKTMEMTASNP